MMTEDLELWKRDPVECIKDLMSNPAFKEHMAYAPERVYTNAEGSEDSRIFDEMWTANWWWKIQVRSSNLPVSLELTLRFRNSYLLARVSAGSSSHPTKRNYRNFRATKLRGRYT